MRSRAVSSPVSTSGASRSLRLCAAALLLLGAGTGCSGRADRVPTSRPALPQLAGLDPRWSVVLGGTASGAAVAAQAGDILVAGAFTGELVLGDHALASAGPSDVFLARLGAGGQPLWLRQLGGAGADRATSMAADEQRVILGVQIEPPIDLGDALVTEAADPVITGQGQPDALLMSLQPDGRVTWAQPVRSTRYARIAAIAVADDGNVTVAGIFAGTVRVGEHALTSAGASDIFVARFGADGAPAWARRLGGPGVDTAHGVASAGAQLALIGYFGGMVDLGPQRIDAPAAFLAVLDPDGPIRALHELGAQTTPRAVAAGPDRALYLAGHFQGSLHLGEHALDSHGSADVFIGRFEATGTPSWLIQIGGPGTDHAGGLAVTPRGPIVAGTFEEQISAGSRALESAGAHDVFAVQLAPDTGAVTMARRFGGPGHEHLGAVVATANAVVLTGSFEGTADMAGHTLEARGETSAFAIELGP